MAYDKPVMTNSFDDSNHLLFRELLEFADRGSVKVMSRLADVYCYGSQVFGIGKDYDKALYWADKGVATDEAFDEAELAMWQRQEEASKQLPPLTTPEHVDERLFELKELEKNGGITKEEAARKRKALRGLKELLKED